MSASILVIGWDTGSAHLGRCTLLVSMTSAEFVECEEIEIGHLAPLKKPKTTKGGKTKTHERVCSAADLEQSRASIRGYLSTARVGHGRPVCGIERSEKVSPRGESGMISVSQATQLKTADYIGGQIDGLACGLDYHVMPVTPEEVRGALCGNQRATDDMVDAAIGLAISGWPKRSNPHKRDAGAVALYCGRKWLSTPYLTFDGSRVEISDLTYKP